MNSTAFWVPFDLGWIRTVLHRNLGHSLRVNGTIAESKTVAGFQFPYIPEGSPTTLMLVPFPVTSTPVPAAEKLIEEGTIVGVFVVAAMIWMLPMFCINRRFCCRCFKRWMSRRMTSYFLLGFVLNFVLISCAISESPNVTANELFFRVVTAVGAFTESFEKVLFQFAILAGAIVALVLRKRIFMLLGYEQQIFKADLKDILTCFSMSRFYVVEVAVFRIEGLPASFTSRTLFLRLILGYNEPQHTRPHEGCRSSYSVKERLQLNFDPEDDTQKMSIIVKEQEVVGSSVAQYAPVFGAVMGAVVNTFTPVGTTTGAGLGIVTGIGAANSLGKEIARVDFSAAQINRLRASSRGGVSQSSAPSVPWREDNFTKVDLVPQGSLWIRIADVPSP